MKDDKLQKHSFGHESRNDNFYKFEPDGHIFDKRVSNVTSEIGSISTNFKASTVKMPLNYSKKRSNDYSKSGSVPLRSKSIKSHKSSKSRRSSVCTNSVQRTIQNYCIKNGLKKM